MTSQSPRIYTYKITFKEVPYYYYGVHKEKKFNEEYWGSPVTHKEYWELYTPKKEIMKVFEYNDKGWNEAQEYEKILIKPVYNKDKWCLNEHCGGMISIETLREAGKKLYTEKKGIHAIPREERVERSKIVGYKTYENGVGVHALTKEEKVEIGRKTYEHGIGIHALTEEERSEASKKGGKKSYEMGVGIHALTKEQRIQNGKKSGKIAGLKNYENKVGIHGFTQEERIETSKRGGKKAREMGVGIHARTKEEMKEQGRINGIKNYENGIGLSSLTKEELSEAGKRGGRAASAQRWMCTETGYVANAGPLASYQKKRGIDTSKRIRLK